MRIKQGESGSMLFPSRAAPADDGSRLRSLNRPRPVEVEAAENGLPRAVVLHGRRLAVEAIFDVWQIDDEWWREVISRRYFLLSLEGGLLRTVYQDLIGGEWFEQHY